MMATPTDDPPSYDFTDQDINYIFDTTRWVDPVTILPSELISLIFVSATKVEISAHDGIWSRKCYPLHLGRVNQAWRSIAWQTSELWATIILRLDKCPFIPTVHLLLYDWLERASGRPLDIFIVSSQRPRSRGVAHAIEPTIHALMQHSTQWRTLDLKMRHQTYDVFVNPLSEFKPEFKHPFTDLPLPILESLTLQSLHTATSSAVTQVPPHGESATLDLATAPKLRELGFRGMFLPTMLSSIVKASNRQIRRLSFTRCPTIAIVHILEQYPALEHLTVSALDGRFNNQSKKITHERLKSIELTVNRDVILRHDLFSPSLNFPALESITIISDYAVQYTSMLQAFLTESTPKSLTHLYLESAAFDESEIIFTLELIPTLTHLSIRVSGFPNAPCEDSTAVTQIFFEQLNPDDTGSYLPRLVDFEYEGYLSVSAIDFLEPLISRSRVRNTNSVDINTTAILRRVKIKAPQSCSTCELSISEYSDPEYIWEIMMMMDMGVLQLLDENGDWWE